MEIVIVILALLVPAGIAGMISNALVRSRRTGLAAALLIATASLSITLFSIGAADTGFLGGLVEAAVGAMLGFGAAPGTIIGMIWGSYKGPYPPEPPPQAPPT